MRETIEISRGTEKTFPIITRTADNDTGTGPSGSDKGTKEVMVREDEVAEKASHAVEN